MNNRDQAEDPDPDRRGKGGDMGKASLEQSHERQKAAPPSKQGPTHVDIPGQGNARSSD